VSWIEVSDTGYRTTVPVHLVAGAVVAPIRETLIAGNVFALLPRIVALSSTAERCSGEARVPYALVDGVAVTAG